MHAIGQFRQREKGPAHANYQYRYYRAEDEVEAKAKEVFGVHAYAEGLKQRLDGYQHPDGSPIFPAKTCKDLRNCRDQNQNGEYTLDPNGGCPGDAFNAQCTFQAKTTETCITPTTTKFDAVNSTHIPSTEQKGWRWLFEDILQTDSQMTFPADVVQLRYMRLNSVSARQHITIHCKNMHVHADGNGNVARHVKVQAADDVELSVKEHHKKRLTMLEDTCGKKDDQWHKTVYEYQTHAVERLPFRDIAFHINPTKFENSAFRIEVGQVCFEQEQ